MTDHLGTLAGLIADLEGLHQPHLDPGDPWCDQEPADWPCPTIELTRKHKRAQYEVIDIGGGEAVVNLVNRRNVQSPYTHIQEFCGPIADAQAWIDRQVNGDA